ncbi:MULTISPECIES: DUF3298 domain-containing protein [unclassified Maridesulfovibrio]|uniref:DUF3298 domain-containing protein n=1 Tax=unclassified Maridesulfovibrio TaxID=2794999 RepID=UPI003B40F76A
MNSAFIEMILSKAGFVGLCVVSVYSLGICIIKYKGHASFDKEQSYKIYMHTMYLFTFVVLFLFITDKFVFYNTRDCVSLSKESPQIVKCRFERRIPDNNPGTNVEVATINIDYIQLTGLNNKIVEKKINWLIKEVVGAHDRYDGTEDLTMIIAKASVDDRFLSVVAEGTYYGHGAGGAANLLECVNLNVDNGEVVEFKDLFRSGYKNKINQLVKRWFKDKGIADHFDTVQDDQKYYYEGAYLSLCFSEYEVACGAEGSIIVPIELNDVRGFISLNGPLAYVI